MFDGTIPDSEHLIQHIHQNGGSEYSGDTATGPAAINSPEALEAFTWWLDLVRVHGVESPQGSIAPEGANRIMDGYSGVELQGPWWVPARRRSHPEVLEQGVVRVGAPLTREDASGPSRCRGLGRSMPTPTSSKMCWPLSASSSRMSTICTIAIRPVQMARRSIKYPNLAALHQRASRFLDRRRTVGQGYRLYASL